MHDLQDRAPPQQVLVSGVPADVGATLARGSVEPLITDRVAEVPGEGQWVRCVPGGRPGDLRRVVALVTDPGAFDGDLAEDGLEGGGPCPSAWDPIAALAVPPLEDQLLVGLLDEGAEEPALDLEASVRDERLDPVGEVLVLVGHGQGHPQAALQGECLTLTVDGTEGEGSLEVVDVTHGGFPYWHDKS